MRTFTLHKIDTKIAFSTLVQVGGKLLQLYLGTMSLRLIARYLTQHEYGVYAGISEYALFFSVVANLGIFAHMVRKMSDQPHDGQTFFDALVLRVSSAVIFFLMGILVLILGGYDTFFLAGVSLYFLALLGDFITTICDAFLQAHYQMGRATFALLLGKVMYTIALYLVVTYQVAQATLFFFTITIISSWLTVAISLYFVRKQVTWVWQIRWQKLKEVFFQSLPFGLITICNSLYFRFLPDFVANNVLSKPEFATFSITFKVAQVVSILSTFLMFSALPGLRRYIDGKNWEKVRKLYKQLTLVLAGLGVALVGIGTLLSPLLIAFLSDKKYVVSDFWFLLPLLLLLAAISYGYDLVLLTLFALNQEKWFLKWEVYTLLLACILLGISTSLANSIEKVAGIALSAIIAESFIIFIGYQKVKSKI